MKERVSQRPYLFEQVKQVKHLGIQLYIFTQCEVNRYCNTTVLGGNGRVVKVFYSKTKRSWFQIPKSEVYIARCQTPTCSLGLSLLKKIKFERISNIKQHIQIYI